MKLARTLIIALLGFAGSAHAAFHLWQINEIYSNADGSVQFVELATLSGGQQFLAGHAITSGQTGAQSKTFQFPNNLPGDTTNRSFLIGTQGFAALNVMEPDFIVPDGFLFTTNGTVNFADVEIVSYATLPTTGGLSINASGATAVNSPKNFAGVSGSIAAAAAGPLNYSDMWWAGKAEDGWGMSIQQHGNVQFNALYIYDSAGKPTWYVMSGGTWNADFTSYTGLLYQPTSAPLNNYTPAQFVVGNSPGNVTLGFTGNSTLTLRYTINGVSGQKSMQRQVFGAGTAPLTVGDMWWAGSTQDGWGINLVQQAGIVFAVWYTYGPDGKPTWYVFPGGTWNGTTYAGTLYSTTGSPWVGANYDPIQFKAAEAGTLSFSFTNANSATMNYTFTAGPFVGTTQSRTIVRQPY
jgi:hypothetical protein